MDPIEGRELLKMTETSIRAKKSKIVVEVLDERIKNRLARGVRGTCTYRGEELKSIKESEIFSLLYVLISRTSSSKALLSCLNSYIRVIVHLKKLLKESL